MTDEQNVNLPGQEPEKPIPPDHKVFDKCPHCGSTRRDGDEEIAYRVKAGLLSKDFPGGVRLQVSIFDPKMMMKSTIMMPGMAKVSVMEYYFDSCAECGTLYRTKMAITEQQVPLQQQGPPPQHGFRPSGNPFKRN